MWKELDTGVKGVDNVLYEDDLAELKHPFSLKDISMENVKDVVVREWLSFILVAGLHVTEIQCDSLRLVEHERGKETGVQPHRHHHEAAAKSRDAKTHLMNEGPDPKRISITSNSSPSITFNSSPVISTKKLDP
ncbi:hypothetical protein Fot_05513 [Forsythia ovata]|uniref:Uncharacterized protein n=1 Tax=Forsythia ovata TaxID=205694 RepID=A0ABD1WQB9_9LAMI